MLMDIPRNRSFQIDIQINSRTTCRVGCKSDVMACWVTVLKTRTNALQHDLGALDAYFAELGFGFSLAVRQMPSLRLLRKSVTVRIVREQGIFQQSVPNVQKYCEVKD
jgi:hypothetical protein